MFSIKLLLTSLLVVILGQSPLRAQDSIASASVSALIKELEFEMNKQHVAGMMLSIVKKDSVLYSGGLGFAHLDPKERVTSHHLFRQASVTKLFIALGVMALVKEGKLLLQANLRDIAPEIPFHNNWELTHPVTIEQLLEHSTGFADKSPFEEYNFSGKNLTDINSLLIFQKMMTCRWKPGERHAYSGVNYAILGYVLEKRSGQPLEHYLRQSVFTPLGMHDANLNLSGTGQGAFASGYVWEGNYFQPVPHQPQFNAAYGSLNASADDFTNALRAYLLDWKTASGQFLSKDWLLRSETPHTYLTAKTGLVNTYAYGNESYELDGRQFRGHRGAIGGFLSAFLYDRQDGVAYSFCINTHNESFYRYADARIGAFLVSHLSKVAIGKTYPVAARDLKPYQGYFRLANPSQLYTGFLEKLKNTFTLDAIGNGITIHLLLGPMMQWQATDRKRLLFKTAWMKRPHIALTTDKEGALVVLDGGLYFEKVSAFEAWAPILALLASFLLVVSSIIFGLVCLIKYLTKKESLSHMVLRLLPALSAGCLLLMIASGMQLMDLMRHASPTQGTYAMWTIGKWVYLVTSLSTIVILVTKWKFLHSQFLKAYLSILAFGMLYLCAVLMINHWY